MQIVTMNRDMRPFQSGHDYALPDDAAAKLIGAGDARRADANDASGLPAEPVAPTRLSLKPRPGGYLARAAKAVAHAG